MRINIATVIEASAMLKTGSKKLKSVPPQNGTHEG
jgi:hypothetical protein